MINLAMLRRFTPCIIVLGIVAVGQYFILTGPLGGYLKEKFTKFSEPPLNPDRRVEEKPPGPVSVLLVSYARTGSSFVGDLLQSYPDAFYFFEPLHFIQEQIINSSYPEVHLLLKRLFRCQVSRIPGFMHWQLTHPGFMKLQRNNRYWKECSKRKSCFNAAFLDRYCANHNAVVIKSIRLTLREAYALFDALPELNLKVIYLSRDPRGTMNSRKKNEIKGWCKKDSKCSDVKEFCSLLREDMDVACTMISERPNDFMILRYEDLSREPLLYAHALAKFLGFNRTAEMESFLRNHTSATVSPKQIIDGVVYFYNTFRNSLLASTKWRQEMKFSQVTRIQKYCKSVLDAVGYHAYNTSSAMKANVYFDSDLDSSITSYCRTRAV